MTRISPPGRAIIRMPDAVIPKGGSRSAPPPVAEGAIAGRGELAWAMSPCDRNKRRAAMRIRTIDYAAAAAASFAVADRTGAHLHFARWAPGPGPGHWAGPAMISGRGEITAPQFGGPGRGTS